MSFSAPQRQPVPEESRFTYPDAGATISPAGGGPSGAPSKEEQKRREQAEFVEQGRQSAQQQLRADLAAALARYREQISHTLQQFALERQSYYRRIEGEVVQLALAIARKVLHREVQIDPHALAGIVRITLEKLDAGSKVTLCVHPNEAADWRHYFACRMEDAPAPEIREDSKISIGECRIETSVGSTEVGLESQLKEIETGLLDLLAERLDPGPLGSHPSTPDAALKAKV